MRRSSAEIGRIQQDYLKAIYRLQEESGPVQTSALANQLGVTAPTVTNMIGRLAEGGFVRHTPYHGVELTETGAAIAVEVIRHHRLWELFLHRALRFPLDHLHDQAEQLEHELSDELEEHISRALGDPTLDPHGDPIPARDGRMPVVASFALTELAVGTPAIVRRVPDDDPALLRYLETLGLLPGASVTLVRREPFHGPLTIMLGDSERILGEELSHRVRVEPREVATDVP